MAATLIQRQVVKLGRFVNLVVFGEGNLLLTNVTISTAMGALGDSLQQHYDLLTTSYENRTQRRRDRVEAAEQEATLRYSWERTAHMSAAGLTTGLVSHFWYIYLDKWMGSKRCLKLITRKVLWDQIVFSPINLCVYFTTLGILERSSIRRIGDEIKEKGLQQIYVAEWFIWPPAQYFNFYVLPLKYRILFDNVISLGFDIYSPYVKYKTELKKERLLKEKHRNQPLVKLPSLDGDPEHEEKDQRR